MWDCLWYNTTKISRFSDFGKYASTHTCMEERCGKEIRPLLSKWTFLSWDNACFDSHGVVRRGHLLLSKLRSMQSTEGVLSTLQHNCCYHCQPMAITASEWERILDDSHILTFPLKNYVLSFYIPKNLCPHRIFTWKLYS